MGQTISHESGGQTWNHQTHQPMEGGRYTCPLLLPIEHSPAACPEA